MNHAVLSFARKLAQKKENVFSFMRYSYSAIHSKPQMQFLNKTSPVNIWMNFAQSSKFSTIFAFLGSCGEIWYHFVSIFCHLNKGWLSSVNFYKVIFVFFRIGPFNFIFPVFGFLALLCRGENAWHFKKIAQVCHLIEFVESNRSSFYAIWTRIFEFQNNLCPSNSTLDFQLW